MSSEQVKCPYCKKEILLQKDRFVCVHCKMLLHNDPHTELKVVIPSQKEIEARCPYCCHIFAKVLPEPFYYAGDIEMNCPTCEKIFMMHMDNFVEFPKFEISYQELVYVFQNNKDRNYGRIFHSLWLKKVQSSENEDVEAWTFIDPRAGKIIDLRAFHERVLRNRDICHFFYGEHMSLIR